MSWFFTVLFLVTALTFHTPSEASHEKNDPSAVVVGTVYCDTCFQEDFSHTSHFISGTSQNVGSLRQLEMEVWAKEREVAGLRASLNTLMSEIQRLNKLCAERKEAEDSLKKKWKKIEEFDYRRSELEIIYTTLLKVNMDAAAFWNQQPLAAREYASSTIIPACTVVMDLSNNEKHLIEREVSAFDQSPDNSLYMIPATPQVCVGS
ncbi:unnamed protein product [Malus baccata var. baccata]